MLALCPGDVRRYLPHPLLDLVVGAQGLDPFRAVPAGPIPSGRFGVDVWCVVDRHREVDQIDMHDPWPDVLDLDAERPDKLTRILDVNALLADQATANARLLQDLA